MNLEIADTPQALVTECSNNMGLGSTLSFKVASALGDASPYALDTVVTYSVSDRLVFKGAVHRLSRAVGGSEDLVLSCRSGDQYIEGLPWVAHFTDYNVDPAPLCSKLYVDATIGDFITAECEDGADGFVTQVVPGWFTEVVVPLSIRDLLAGSTTTHLKSFFTALNGILSPYPFIKMVVQYEASDPDTLFPLGKLVLIDTRVGTGAITLHVGGATPDIGNEPTIELDTSDSAETLKVYGRGAYTEKAALLEPAWDVQNPWVQITTLLSDPEQDKRDKTKLYSYYTYGADEFFENPVITVDGQPAFKSADYDVDPSNNRIVWHNRNVAVNPADGSIATYPTAGWRLPWAATGLTGKVLSMTSKNLRADAYRKYKLPTAVGLLRLEKGRVADPINTGAWIEKAVDSKYEPVFCAAPTHIYGALNGDLEGPLTPAEWQAVDERLMKARPLPGNPEPSSPNLPHKLIRGNCVVKGSSPNAVWEPVIRAPATARFGSTLDTDQGTILFADKGDYCITQTTSAFEVVDGGRCIKFSQPQLGYVTRYQRDTSGDVNSFSKSILYFTWEVACLYTAWAEVVQTRTSTLGKFRHLPTVLEAGYIYTDITGAVIEDTTNKLVLAADAIKEWSDTPNYSGSLDILCTYDEEESRWVVPVSVGHRVSLSGSVSAAVSSLGFVINSIDYSTLDSGFVRASLGRKEPRKNPFNPAPPARVRLDKGNEIDEVSGLSMR